MKLLLDSHAFIFFTCDPAQLPNAARTALEDPSNELFLSIASPWEMQIKSDLKKLRLRDSVINLVNFECNRGSLKLLSLELVHVDELSRLPAIHRDPFDRIIIAQARHERLRLVTGDNKFPLYGVDLLWD